MSTIDDLLDQSLDDLAELPEFKPFPPGVHQVEIEFATKEINKHPSVELSMKMVRTVEMADPTEPVAEPGATTSVAFMLDNEFGQGNLKKLAAPIAKHMGIDLAEKGSLRKVVEGSKGMIVQIVSNVRKGKEEGTFFMNVKDLSVV